MRKLSILSMMSLALAACGEVHPTYVDGSMDQDAGVDAMPPDGPVSSMVSLTVTRNGTGTVTGSPGGLDCGATCTVMVAKGTQVTLTEVPGASSTFGHWGGACAGTAATCVLTLNADTAVTADFAIAMRTITVAVSGNGAGTVTSTPAGLSCPGTCTTSVAHGTSVTLTAAPSGASTFLGWSGSTACTGTGPCTFTATADTTINAVFSLDYTLVVTRSGNAAAGGSVSSAPAGITCGATCNHTYAVGTVVTLTAAPPANADFTGWSGGGCSGTGTCTVTINSSVSVDASFTLRTYTLTAAAAGTGGGVITSTPAGITCGGGNTMCSQAYNHGTVVNLTATPNGSSTFTGWSGACTGAGACAVTMDQARSVTATFALNQYTLTVTRSGNAASLGSVTSSPAGIACGPTCSASFGAGAVVTLTASAPAGTSFNGWSGGGCSGTGTCIVTVNAAASVGATFTLQAYTLTVAITGSGSVASSPAGITCPGDCSEPYDYTTSVTLTATPGAGATFAGWSGGGCGAANPCTLSMPATATTVTASFGTVTYDTTITGSPLSTTSATTATFSFATVPAGGTSFECALDEDAFVACSSPTTYAALGTTNHRFRVRALSGGVPDASPASYGWFITGNNQPRLPDSPTAYCTTGSAATTCPANLAGQDGNYRVNVPSYTTTASTVTDSVTSLMWERNVTGAANQSGAITYCQDLVLDGFSDWRLPSIFELNTIVDAGRVGAPFEPVAFPGIPSNSFLRTSTPVPGIAGNSYTINTNYALLYAFADTDTQPVRCVRGTMGGGTLISYSVNTVFDGRTNLYWQKTTVAPGTWQAALAACEASTVDGFTDWHLPSQKELASIVDTSQSMPTLSTLFTERQAETFWTSTPVPNFPADAYAISFTYGTNANITNPQSGSFRARCVR